MPYSYQYASENQHLCRHCLRKPFSSNPHTGGDFCEGEGCQDAWVKYLEYELENPCDTCKNKGWESMGAVASCNCCENYEFYTPNDGCEEDE